MTKIMTFYTCMKILLGDMVAVNINPKNTYMRASAKAAKMGGTTAFIREGLYYSIYDLLIGLMLPSGNDASMVLAENFGKFLLMESARTSTIKLKELLEQDSFHIEFSKICVRTFIKRMN